MSHSYSIWHEVNSSCYKSSKSYGSKGYSEEDIYVGTSAKNSHHHCRVCTTRRTAYLPKYGDCHIFRTSIDGIVLVETIVSVKDKVVVKRKSKLKHIKSL